MQIIQFSAIILFCANCIISNASYEDIAGYAPGSKVTDHNAIDLDQKALEEFLAATTTMYAEAKDVYEQGGNSKTYAEFTVPALTKKLNKGDEIQGQGSGIKGKMYSDAAQGATTIKVAYPTSDKQATYVGCKGGALKAAPAGVTPAANEPYKLTSACFDDKEQLKIGDLTIEPTAGPMNKAGRTLQGFSTKAEQLMYVSGSHGGCGKRDTDGCPYRDFKMYYDYYSQGDYANKLVLAALDEGLFAGMNFGSAEQGMNDIRIQVIKKGTAYMNAYMYAIREFEDAIDDCKAGCAGGKNAQVAGKDCNALSTNAVHAWDEGVAFYTGSLEGATTGGKGDGKLSYRLAEKRCGNFKTCGDSMDQTTGTSYVNIELFKYLAQGNTKLLEGKCEDVRPILDNMTALMSIPLIQGTLRYAYKVGKQSGGATEKGEGAIFAAAIVPRVANCGAEDANTIMQHMQLGAATTDFEKVKTAFENNYACMKIDCKHVGGLWDADSNPPKYFAGAEPCGGAVPTTASPSDVSRAPSLVSPSLVLIAAAVALLPRALQ
jgi:hypothetical protein